MGRAALRRQRVYLQQLLFWVPLLASAAGAVILIGLHPASPIYLTLLMAIMVFNLLVLFGPAPLRSVLGNRAPVIHVLLLLAVWVSALYVLPTHPATPMALLACVLHLSTLYVSFFVSQSPRAASLQAYATLAAFIVTALPYSWQSFGQLGAFDGVTMPLTLLFAHGALILVLQSFSQARVQLVQAEGRLQHLHDLAYRDSLTGLLNRRALDYDLACAVEEEQPTWVLAVIDVDGLKRVNDTLGHASGDDLLHRFAKGFARAVEPGGQAYRLSGDEFVLLLYNSRPDAAQGIVESVTCQIRQVYGQASASVGAEQWRRGEPASEWLSRADQAMYQHKQRYQEKRSRGMWRP